MSQLNCSHSNAIDLPVTFTRDSEEKALILIFLPVVTFFGNVGNLAFLYAGFRVPHMRTVANMYFFNLAVADVLFLNIVFGSVVWTYVMSPVIRDNNAYNSAIWCWLTYYPTILCYYVSIQMLTLVSFERYLAICQPLEHHRLAGKRRTKRQIVGSWVIAAISAVALTFRFGGVEVLGTVCVGSIAGGPNIEPFIVTFSDCKNSFGLVWSSLVSEIINDVLFLAAMISSCFTYVKIIQALTRREESNLQSNQQNTNGSVRKQVAIILIVNGTIFFICQIPYRFNGVHNITADTLQIWSLSEKQADSLKYFARICLIVNSAINPYIYILGSKYYRQAVMEAFCLKGPTAKPATKTTSVTSSPAVTKM